MNVTLKVYEADMITVKKECTAELITIPFGTIRKFMALFDIDNIDDTSKILKIVASSWGDVINLLGRVFPEMTEDDWDTVDTKELLHAVIEVLKFAFADILKVPTDGKN